MLTPECLKVHILFQKVTYCGKIASFFGGELLEFSRNSRLTTTQPESDQPLSAVVLNPGCMGQSIRKPKKKKKKMGAQLQSRHLPQNLCEVISLISFFAHI